MVADGPETGTGRTAGRNHRNGSIRCKEKETTTSTVDDNLKKLLLVEDNQEFRTFLKEQLEDFYQIIEAADGEEGERKAIEENPNLIISDIMMPKVDGIELCRRIKTNVQTSHIPVILLTARTADVIKINSYEVGADSYMSKPFNFDMLMVRIEKLIEQQEKRKQEFRFKRMLRIKSVGVCPVMDCNLR